jgi:hypothetical protein
MPSKPTVDPNSTPPIEDSGIESRTVQLQEDKWRFLPKKPPDISPPVGVVFANAAAASEAARIMGDVWKNEETRFNNLNTPGVAVLSATALVTAVLGFFSKNLLDKSLNGARWFAIGSTWGVLIVLGVTGGFIVLGVLRPSMRPLFGGNALTTKGDTAEPRTFSAQAVDAVAYQEYGAFYAQLANRSSSKAYWLTWAYYIFFLAIAATVLLTGIILIWASATAP